MKEIVKYHNDFNKIKLPSFTAQEQNMLFGILMKLKNKGANKEISFTPQELLSFSTDNLSNKALGDMLFILRDKFFKANFTILIEDKERDLIGKEIINLFQSFKLWYPKGDTNYNHLQRVELQVNPRFEYLINEITSNFTRFELAEFMELSGKYTKTLYRLLKQYRSTGTTKFEWEDFKRIMDIPENYEMRDIEKRILKPALKELTKERNLFDLQRIPFQNLTYEKIKGKGRGRGGNVIGIVFTFKPENLIEQEQLELEQNNLENENEFYKKQNQDLVRMLGMNQEFGNLVGRSFYNEQGEVIKIQNAYKKINGEIETIFKNSESEKIFTKNFENEKHFRNYLKKFEVF